MGVTCVQQWTEDNGLMTILKLTGNLMASEYRRPFLPQIVQYRVEWWRKAVAGTLLRDTLHAIVNRERYYTPEFLWFLFKP